MTNEQNADPEQPSQSVGLGPMGCRPSLEELYQYMDGVLDEDRQARISSHLHRCDGCDDFYHFHTGLKHLLETRCQCDLPADLPQRVFRALDELR